MIRRLRQKNHLVELIIEACLVKYDSMKIVINYILPENYDQDFISKVQPFLFPFKKEYESSTVEQFVFTLTGADGILTYGFCRLSAGSSSCLCIISCYSFFEIFYRLLNEIALLKNEFSKEKILDFLSSILEIRDILPGSSFELLTEVDNIKFDFPNGHIFLSIPQSKILTEYFCAFDSITMMKLFASMLNERRIIITSLKLNRITSIIHSAVNLLYPLVWQHIFIPILPLHLLDYLSAPMPYIIGIHSSLWKNVHKEDIGDVVIVDADNNNLITPFHDLAAMPTTITQKLKKRLSNKNTSKDNSFLGNGISLAFLNAMCSLLGNYREGLKLDGNKIIFDNDLFISKQPAEIRDYLIQISSLQMFHEFINSRVDKIGANVPFNDVFEKEIIGKEIYKKDKKKKKISYKPIHLLKKGIKKLEMDSCSKINDNSPDFQAKNVPNIDKNQNIITSSPKNSLSELHPLNILNLEDLSIVSNIFNEKLVNFIPRTPKSLAPSNSIQNSTQNISYTNSYSPNSQKPHYSKNNSELNMSTYTPDIIFTSDNTNLFRTSVSSESICNLLPKTEISPQNNLSREKRLSSNQRSKSGSIPNKNNSDPFIAGGAEWSSFKTGINCLRDGSSSSSTDTFEAKDFIDYSQLQNIKVSKKLSVQEIIKLYEIKDANVLISRPTSLASERSNKTESTMKAQFKMIKTGNLQENEINNNPQSSKNYPLDFNQDLTQEFYQVNISERTSTVVANNSQAVNIRSNSQKGLSRSSAFKRNSIKTSLISTNNKIPTFGIDYNTKILSNDTTDNL